MCVCVCVCVRACVRACVRVCVLRVLFFFFFLSFFLFCVAHSETCALSFAAMRTCGFVSKCSLHVDHFHLALLLFVAAAVLHSPACVLFGVCF